MFGQIQKGGRLEWAQGDPVVSSDELPTDAEIVRDVLLAESERRLAQLPRFLERGAEISTTCVGMS